MNTMTPERITSPDAGRAIRPADGEGFDLFVLVLHDGWIEERRIGRVKDQMAAEAFLGSELAE